MGDLNRRRFIPEPLPIGIGPQRSKETEMKILKTRSTARRRRAAVTFVALALLLTPLAFAQSPIATGLASPTGLGTTYAGNILVPQGGTGNNDGLIEILRPWGKSYPLVSGLPSAIPPEDSVSGPTAAVSTLSTVYVLIGEGNAMGPSIPPTQVPNVDGLSSPIFSSLLEMHFDPVPDAVREGFVLSAENIQTLADGHTVHLENDSAEQVWIRVLSDFRDFVPDPVVSVRQSNPFALELVGSLAAEDYEEFAIPGVASTGLDFLAELLPDSPIGQRLRERSMLYVVDAGMNALRAVDVLHGRSRIVARFPPVPNPLFPTLGGPVADAVPFGLASRDDKLLVSLFTGFPFNPQSSSIVEYDPATGTVVPVLEGLTLTGEMLAVGEDLYVVEFSADLLSGAPGSLLRFGPGSATPEVVAAPLIGPVGMVPAGANGDIFVSEIFTGSVVRVQP